MPILNWAMVVFMLARDSYFNYKGNEESNVCHYHLNKTEKKGSNFFIEA